MTAILRILTFYATVGALAINPLHIAKPALIATFLKILSVAAIPAMIIVLGVQLDNVTFKESLLPAGVATMLRLIPSPA